MLEGANSTISSTIGIIRNLPILIGGITFFVQAQVIDRAPYRLLLGRPFYAISGAIHSSSLDGSTRIELTNPNSPFECIVLPTRERFKSPGKQYNSVHYVEEYPFWYLKNSQNLEALKSLMNATESEIQKHFHLPQLSKKEINFGRL